MAIFGGNEIDYYCGRALRLVNIIFETVCVLRPQSAFYTHTHILSVIRSIQVSSGLM